MRINVASFAPSPAAALPQVIDASTTSCRPRREQHLLTPRSTACCTTTSSSSGAQRQVVDASTTSCRPRREQHLLTPLSSEEEHGLLHHDVELIWIPSAERWPMEVVPSVP